MLFGYLFCFSRAFVLVVVVIVLGFTIIIDNYFAHQNYMMYAIARVMENLDLAWKTTKKHTTPIINKNGRWWYVNEVDRPATTTKKSITFY